MWGRKEINSEETMGVYERSDPDKAIKNLKDVMTAMKYLQDTDVNTRLIDEKERVAARLKKLDEDLMPKWKRETNSGEEWDKWVSKDLESEWNKFMKAQATKARDKAVKYMDDYIEDLVDAYLTATNENISNKPGEENAILKTLLEKIRKLRDEWKRYKPISWTNPF